jgi:hypothetical protein
MRSHLGKLTSSWALASYTLLAYAVCYPGLFTGTQTLFCRDYSSYSLPVAEYTKQAWLSGHIPLWDPYNLNGIPFFAQWSPMVLYPGTLIYVILPVTYGLPIFMLVHFVLGGVGFRRLVIKLGGDLFPATMSAFFYACGSISLSLMCWPAHCASYGLSPWVIWAMLKIRSRHDIGIAALITTLQLFTGSPEIIAITWVTAITLFLVTRFKEWFKLTLTLSLALGIASIQLLPFLTLLLNSNRINAASLDWSLTGDHLLNYLIPAYRSTPTNYGFSFITNQKWLLCYYLPIPFILAGVTIVKAARNPQIITLGALSLLGLICASMPSLPFLSSVVAHLPIGIIRYPIKYLLLTNITMLVIIGLYHWKLTKSQMPYLAGLLAVICGLELILAPAQLHSICIHAGLALLFLMACTRAAWWQAPICIGLLTLEVLSLPHYPTINSNAYHKFPNSIYLALGEGRIQRVEANDIDKNLEQDLSYRNQLLSRNRNLPEHIPSAGGFFSMYLDKQAQLNSSLYEAENPSRTEPSNYFNFIGIRYERHKNYLVPREGGLPMLSIGQIPILASNDVEQTLHIDLSHFVLLATPFTNTTYDQKSKILKQKVTPEQIEADVYATQPTYLVIAQSYYPCWCATVNNTNAKIYLANAAFQAIKLPPGNSHVSLQYQDVQLKTGKILTILSLLITLSLLFPTKPTHEIQPS